MNIKLNLITDKQEELSSLAVQFNRELEDPDTPPFPKAATLQVLKEKLKAALIKQKGFTEIWEKAQTNAQKQEVPKWLEETAKFLVAIVSVSLTVFISKRPEGLEAWADNSFIWVAVIWIISMLLSFFVLFSWRYNFNPESAEDIERTYCKISNAKWWLLVLKHHTLGLRLYPIYKINLN